MVKKVIAIILLLGAVGGLVYGVLGIAKKVTTVNVKTDWFEGVYNLETKSIEGTAQVKWSSDSIKGGHSLSDIPQIAEDQANAERTRQMLIGFGAFVVLGIAGSAVWKKVKL